MGRNKHRRLSGGFIKPEEVENLFDENDDDAERVQAAVVKKKEVQAVKSPLPTPGQQRKTALLTDMYSECIQLAAENKVNEKNSWALNLIDHMGGMMEQQQSTEGGDMTNFQLASSTLDAGVKIYSCRVDSVYTETFKLIGGLNRTTKGQPAEEAVEEGDENADANEGEPADAAQKAKKALKRAPSALRTLEANPESLNVKALEMAFAVDPLFHRTSANFDDGGAKGLLLHNLPVQRDCGLVFDSTDAIEPAADTKPVPLCAETLRAALPAPAPAGRAVCAGVERFRPLVRHGTPGTAAATAESRPAADDDDDDDYCEPAPPEDTSGWADEEVAAGTAYDAADELACKDLASPLKPRHPGFEARMSSAAFVYDGIDFNEEGDGDGEADADDDGAKGWAGPAHWKFKAAPKPKAADATAGRKEGRGAGKAPLVIDFGAAAEVVARLSEAVVDVAGTSVSEANLNKPADVTLPDDCQRRVDALCRLFHKPAVRVVRRKRAVAAGAPADGTTMLRGESVTALRPIPGDGPVADDDDDDAWVEPAAADDDEVDMGAAPPAEFAAGVFDTADLVDAPEQVCAADVACSPPRRHRVGALWRRCVPHAHPAPLAQVRKIDIGHAKVAKQVDIKGLKGAVSSLLAEEIAAADTKKGSPKTIKFSKIVSRLGERIPPAEMSEITFSYTFICMLHLANEHGYEVVGDEDMTDMAVTGQ